MPDIRILTESELRSQIQLDLDAIECVENAFHALATKAVIMPPIMRLDIIDNNGEIDVKTAYIPGVNSLAIKIFFFKAKGVERLSRSIMLTILLKNGPNILIFQGTMVLIH